MKNGRYVAFCNLGMQYQTKYQKSQGRVFKVVLLLPLMSYDMGSPGNSETLSHTQSITFISVMITKQLANLITR